MARFDDIGAGILVGGSGTRLGGVDKARLRPTAEGPTFVERLVTDLRPRVASVVLLGRAGQCYEETGCRLLADETPGCGPMGGLQTLLAHARTPWSWLVACDLPWFDAGLLDTLAARRNTDPDRVVHAVVPLGSHGLEPTAALYHRQALPHVERCIAAGHFSMRRLIEELPHVVVPLSAPQQACLANVNRPEDLDRLKRTFARGKPECKRR